MAPLSRHIFIFRSIFFRTRTFFTRNVDLLSTFSVQRNLKPRIPPIPPSKPRKPFAKKIHIVERSPRRNNPHREKNPNPRPPHLSPPDANQLPPRGEAAIENGPRRTPIPGKRDEASPSRPFGSNRFVDFSYAPHEQGILRLELHQGDVLGLQALVAHPLSVHLGSEQLEGRLRQARTASEMKNKLN